jgi:hypothetical protein
MESLLRTVRRRWVVAAAVATVLLCLLPWWKQRGYLRDFYDYGLVMAGVGRISAGERPYVDFTTPIQSGIFLLNGWAERLFGGTYQAMTVGGALLIVASFAALAGMLARRWPVWAAGVMAAAVVCGAPVQHTIVWHNSLGAICLAVAALSSALAPLWRRADLRWNALTAAALIVGGVNKLNFHLVSMAVVGCWLLRAGIAGRASRWNLLVGGAHVAIWGVLIPVAFETVWTGASFAEWRSNVIGLAVEGRAEYLAELLKGATYGRPVHDYYGSLVLPQVGWVGLALTLGVAAVGIWHANAQGALRDVAMIPLACIACAVASLALLVTNHEIAYVALAAWLALLAAVWLGFDLPRRGPLLAAVLVVPAALLSAVFWHSAWNGQRSQFGHSSVARSEYLQADAAGEAFSYLKGTALPPDMVQSLLAAADWRLPLSTHGATRVFHGPGLEFLDRIWPAPRPKGQPLWMHDGTSYDREQAARLARSLLPGGLYDHVVVPIAHEGWPGQARLAIECGYEALTRGLGPLFRLYQRRDPPNSLSDRPFAFMEALGGNVHQDLLTTDLELLLAADAGFALGVRSGSGTLDVVRPTFRLSGEMLLSREGSPGEQEPLAARFEIERDPKGDSAYMMVSTEIELPGGTDHLVQPFSVETVGLPVRLVVTLPPGSAPGAVAGWRNLRISHAAAGPEVPDRFSDRAAEPERLDEATLQALLPDGWRPTKAFMRGGRLTADGIELPPRGELWLWHDGVVSEMIGEVSVSAEATSASRAAVRVLGYKNGRIEITSQGHVDRSARVMGFRTWSPEPGSWLVVVVGAEDGAPPVRVNITRVAVAE